MSRLSQKEAFEVIGGPLLIDWKINFLAAPFVIVFSLLIYANLLTPQRAPFVLFIAFASTLAMFGWGLLFDKSFFRNRHKKSIAPIWIVLFGLGLGIVKGLTSEFLIVWFGFGEPSVLSTLQRALPTALATLTYVLIVPLSERNRIQYQAKRDSLVGTIVQQELDQRKDYFDDTDLEKISAGIQKVRSSTTSKQASERLRTLVEKVIRPQSHQLWKKETSRFPNYTLRELLGYALLNQPFNPLRSSLLTALGIFLFNVFREQPFMTALWRTLTFWAIVFVFYLVASQINVTTVTSGIWLFGMVVLLSSVSSTFASIVLIGQPYFSIVIANFIVYFFWQLMNTLAVAGIRAVFDSSKTVEEELAKLNEDGALDESVREIIGRIDSRELADHLHSTVQNQVLASSLRLAKADLTKQEITQELDVLEGFLEAKSATYAKLDGSSIENELKEMKTRWDGFIKIEYSINTSVPRNQKKRIKQILEEAISNASRHGHAENIEILITESGASLLLSVVDDGFGPRSGKPGLGTSLFETSSLGRWEFEPVDGGGSRLVVLL